MLLETVPQQGGLSRLSRQSRVSVRKERVAAGEGELRVEDEVVARVRVGAEVRRRRREQRQRQAVVGRRQAAAAGRQARARRDSPGAGNQQLAEVQSGGRRGVRVQSRRVQVRQKRGRMEGGRGTHVGARADRSGRGRCQVVVMMVMVVRGEKLQGVRRRGSTAYVVTVATVAARAALARVWPWKEKFAAAVAVQAAAARVVQKVVAF